MAIINTPTMTSQVSTAENNVFLADIDMPVWEPGMISLFPQFFKYELGRNYYTGEEGLTQPYWNYEQMNRTVSQLVVDAVVSGDGTPTVVFDSTDTDATYGQKAVVNMTFLLNDLTPARISATPSYTSGNWRYTITTIDGSNITVATQVQVGAALLPQSVNLDANWTMPDPLHFYGNHKTNGMSIIGNTVTWGGIQAAQKKWINGTDGKPLYWYVQEQVDAMANHFNDIMKADFFNVASPSFVTGHISGAGMVPIISQSGLDITYTGGATVADLNDMLGQLSIYSPAKRFICYCGQKFMNSLMDDIQPTVKFGAVDYGAFADFKEWGVKPPTNYIYGDREVIFEVVPFLTDPLMQSGATSQPQLSNYAIFVAVDPIAGNRNGIQRKYLTTNEGPSLKYLMKQNPGMFPNSYGAFNNLATNRTSQNEMYILSVLGLHVAAGEWHGILRAE